MDQIIILISVSQKVEGGAGREERNCEQSYVVESNI